MNRQDTPQDSLKQASDDAALAALLRDSLRASERSLDTETLAKLRAARARAVATAAKPAGLRWPWAVALPAACAAAFAGWIALTPPRPAALPEGAAVQSAQIEMLELLGSDEAPVGEDEVDFARWLEDAHGDS